MEKKIGFIGLGSMGLSMAKNLIAAGHQLQVYNRTASKAEELKGPSVTICKSPAQAADGTYLIITMLTEDDILHEATAGKDGILKTLPKNAVHISMSTISPETSEQLAVLHNNAGNHYIAAPVFGRPEAAAAKKLWICVSGNAEAKKIANPILEAMGQGVVDFGEKVSAANVIKITGNFMILASMEVMAEAYTLAEKNGLNRTQVSDFFCSTIFNAPVFNNYGKIIANKSYGGEGLKSKLGYKDARLTLKLAQQSETPMPMAMIAHNRLLTAVAKGNGDVDWAEGVGRGVSEDAGV